MCENEPDDELTHRLQALMATPVEAKKLRNKGLVWYLAAQFVVLICFYWPWLTGSSSYYFQDVTHYVEPLCRFIGDSYRHLHVPLWNPWLYCGMSQVSVAILGIFYPPTWLFAVFPFNTALAANMILHQLLCGLGGFLLIASWEWGVVPAIVCGITLAMSGYMFSLVPNFNLVATAAWCPLSLWAVQEVGRAAASGTANGKRVLSRTIIAAICVGMLILAGQPELISLAMGAICVQVIVSGYTQWKSGDADWKASALSQARAVLLGLLLAMPVILPALEWLKVSRRSGGMLATESMLLSANWYDLLNLVLPQPLGDLQMRYSEFRGLILPGRLMPYVGAAFVGPVVATLSMCGFFDTRWRQRWLVLALLVLSVLLTMGINGPLVPALLTVFPSLGFIRFPIKELFFVVLCLSIAAARGLYSIPQETAKIIPVGVIWLVFCGVGALFSMQAHQLLLPVAVGNIPSLQALGLKAQALIGQSILLWGFDGLAVTLLLLLINKRKERTFSLVACLIVAAVVTLLYYPLHFYHRGGPSRFFEQPSYVASELKRLRAENSKTGGNVHDSRSLTLYFENFVVPLSYVGKDPLPATISMYQYSRDVLRPNTNIDFKEPSSFGFEGSATGDYYHFLLNCYLKSSQSVESAAGQKSADAALARFCQYTATKYVIAQIYRFDKTGNAVSIPLLDNRWFVPVSTNIALNVRIYEVSETLPRAYFSSSWKWADSRDAAVEDVFLPEKSGFDPSKQTIIERLQSAPAEGAGVPAGNRQDGNMPNGTSGEASTAMSPMNIDEDNGNDVSVTVNAPAAGFLVLADQYYPGWVADVDGKSSAILSANGFTRAVAVPAGSHKVHFRYQPMSVIGGVALLVLAVVWMTYLWFVSRYEEQGA